MFRNQPIKHACHPHHGRQSALPYVPTMAAVMLCLFTALPAHGGEIEPPAVHFAGQGFTVQAPPGARLLELRIANPDREIVFEERSGGDPISWYLGGTPKEGEYRYEAVTVTDIDGIPQQANAAGGFTVEGGVLIPPPEPVYLGSPR